MSDSYTLLNGASVVGGDYVDMESITYGAAPTTRKRTRTVISGSVQAAIADVINTEPGAGVYALPVRYPGLTTAVGATSSYALPVKPEVSKYHSDVAVASALWQVGAYAWHGAGALSANKVASGDIAGLYCDRFGRLLTVHADAGSVLWKALSTSTTQTGTIIGLGGGAFSATLREVYTHAMITVSGTVAGRVTLWWGANADTTYTEGTDQVLMDIEVIPSATRSETYILSAPAPVYGPLNKTLRLTTSAAINPLRVGVYGYIQDET